MPLDPETHDEGIDEATLNPAGAARRRLIKALGLSAVASQVALDWREPKLHLGGLPAHAAGSPRLCPFNVSMSYTATLSGTNPISVGIVPESLFSTTLGDGSFSTEFMTVLPTGTNSISVAWERGVSGDVFDYEFSASCCVATADSSGGAEDFEPLSGDEGVFAVQVGDGTCSFQPI